jgi:molybdate transport system substrate-binding protein
VVSYENDVKAVLAKVTLAEADAGIVYATDAASAGEQVKTLPIADPLNVTAIYPVAVVQDGQNQQLARDFVALLISPAGQKILARYGFLPVQ